jgi:hypothetical protein
LEELSPLPTQVVSLITTEEENDPMKKPMPPLCKIARKLFILAALLILFTTGCSPKISSFQPVVATPTSFETATSAVIATDASTPLTISGCLSSDVCPSANLIRRYFEEGETLYYNTQYSVVVPFGDEIRFFYGWCTIDRPTLDENQAHMEYVFTIDGVSYLDKIEQGYTSMQDENNSFVYYPCYSIGGVLSGWKVGEPHQIVIGAKFLEDIYDGWTTSDAGDYLMLYEIDPTP